MQAISVSRQRGVALFVGLMILLMLTLLGLTSSNVSIMQERMASNVREYNVAFQQAEATLREIEDRLVQMAAGTTGGLPVIPTWADDLNLVNMPNDCTLERRYGVDWDNVPWQTAPTTGNDFFIIALGDYINPNTGLPQGSACRPMDDNQRSDGTPVSDRYYLVLARAFGPGDASRRAEALVQTIFFWPE
ncbi:MAG: hypothetical protein HND55_14365 [Pseudomonadota bacterium]|nr:MAG: hypothetical protein HND55_14365 [Pseudomonadota bacterium]